MCPRPPEPGTLQPLSSLVPLPVGPFYPRDPLCPSVVKDFSTQCVPGRLSQEPFNPVLLRAPFVPLVIGPSYPVILCVPLWSRVFRCNVSQAA